MKKITIALSMIFLFATAKISAQTCNMTLAVTISGVVNSSTCITPCNGQATGNCPTATGYLWTAGNQTTATATGMCAGTYTCYAYDASFNCGAATITITCPQGVHENEMSAFVDVFPNPAFDNVSITLSYSNGGDVKEISVFNSIGEKVLSENFTSSKKFLNKLYVGNLPSGIYFLDLKDEKNSYRTKFIKE